MLLLQHGPLSRHHLSLLFSFLLLVSVRLVAGLLVYPGCQSRVDRPVRRKSAAKGTTEKSKPVKDVEKETVTLYLQVVDWEKEGSTLPGSIPLHRRQVSVQGV